MNRIFLTLSIVSNLAILGAFALGWRIDDPRAPDAGDAVSVHFLVALGSSIIALLVHAVALTYFMGTGRWIEETCEAYRLGEEPRRRNIRLKYQVIPGMVVCIALILATGALGAVADPASSYDMAGSATIHFGLAVATLLGNGVASWIEHRCIARNGRLVTRIVEEVRTIRRAKGLDPAPGTPSGAEFPAT